MSAKRSQLRDRLASSSSESKTKKKLPRGKEQSVGRSVSFFLKNAEVHRQRLRHAGGNDE